MLPNPNTYMKEFFDYFSIKILVAGYQKKNENITNIFPV